MEKLNKKKLTVKIAITIIIGIGTIGLILFLSAGTIFFWNAWLFLSLILISITYEISFLILKEPELLVKRLKTKENIGRQNILAKLSSMLTGIAIVIAGIDWRYSWSDVPIWMTVMGAIFFEVGYFIYMEVIKQNRYASRIIEVQDNQKVIDFGLYSIIRHPMYLAINITNFSMCIVLGSFFALIPISLCFVLVILRIIDEEKFLKEELEGYKAYMMKVKYRLIPFIW